MTETRGRAKLVALSAVNIPPVLVEVLHAVPIGVPTAPAAPGNDPGWCVRLHRQRHTYLVIFLLAFGHYRIV